MNGYVIAAAVIDRLQADSTLYTAGAWTSVVPGGVATIRGNPSDVTMPYAVVDVSWTADHAMASLSGDATVTLTYFYRNDVTNGGRAWVDRVIGDAMLSSGTNYAPTYGLHNHPLALPSIGADNVLGITADVLNYQSFDMGPSDSPDVKAVTLVFGVRLTKTAVNK